ncbi:hypothetical protein ACSBR1_009860 [Camellia fascicularis]
MEKLSHSVSKKLYNNANANANGFSTHTVYDDVFGGPPKFGIPTFSPRIEDYSEIFGSFHASRPSSIPILDLPAVDEAEFSFDIRTSHFDYSQVFGGFEGLDFAVSFDELFNHSKTAYDSSDEAWTPAQSGYLSDASDPSACSERNQSLSNEEFYQSCDGIKLFNISYDKASQRSKGDMSNRMAHVTQLHAVPGFSFVVNETPPSQKRNMPLQKTDDLIPNVDFSRGLREGKQFRKTMSHPSSSNFDIQSLGTDLKPVGYGKTASSVNEELLTVSDIGLRTQPSRLPPPSRPPPVLAAEDGDSDRQKSKLKASKSFSFGETAGDSSPPFFDVEVDASSSASVSAAVMKEAMDKAQAKLRSAKIMERKEGLQTRAKLGLKNDAKDREGKASKTFDGSSYFKDERVHGTCQSDCSGMKSFAVEEMQKVMKTARVVSDSIEGENHINVAKVSADKKHGKEYRSAQEYYKTEEHFEWREATQFYGVVETDKSRKISEQVKDERVSVQNTQFCERGQEKKATPAFQQQEDDNRKIKDDREAREWDGNKGRSKATKESNIQEEHEKKAKANQKVCKQEENGKKTRMVQQQHGDIEKIQTEADQSKESQNLPEVQQKENEVEVERKQKEAAERIEDEKRHEDAHERRLKETLERERYEKILKEATEQAEIERRLMEALDREEKEKQQKEASEREEKEKRQKEAREREDNEKRLKEAREREENEKRFKEEENQKRLKEALEREEAEKRLKEACEREENEKRLKEALEREETVKREKEACEREEKEKRLKEAHEREENEKRLKEAREREENEKRLKEEENQKRLEEVREREENEKRLKEAREREENEKRLKEAREREENEKRLKEEENRKRLKEAHEREENEKRLKEALEQEENKKRLQEALEREETEKRQKEACEREEKEKRQKEVREREEKEKRQKEAREREDNEKRLKEACEREENEKRLKEALEQEENKKRLKEALELEEIEKRLKMALEQEENEKRKKLACERDENEKRLVENLRREEIEKKLSGALRQEENGKNKKGAHDTEENEERLNEACEREENEKSLEEASEQEVSKKRLQEAHERQENEKRSKEAFKHKEIEKISEEANDCEKTQKMTEDAGYWEELKGHSRDHEQNERDENERKLHSDQGTCVHTQVNFKASDGVCKLGDCENLQPDQAVCGQDKNSVKVKKTEGARLFEEDRNMKAESMDSEGQVEAVEVVNVLFEEQSISSGMGQNDSQHEKNQTRVKDATESLDLHDTLKESVEPGIGIGIGQHMDRNKKAFEIASNTGKPNVINYALGERGNNVKEVQMTFDKEESKDKFMSSQVVRELIENGRKMGADQPTVFERKRHAQSTAQKVSTSQNTERKEKKLNGILTSEEREKQERMKRERELENDCLRKIEEEREREREREKDLMAVDRATLEARERAFSEAHDRAVRAAVERATAEVRQRAMTEARERLEKACAEARERSLAEKTSMEARLRAERAAVERATAEARQRAFQKVMAEKAAFEARECVERSVADKSSASYKNGGMTQSSSFSDVQSQGVGSSIGSIYSYSSVHGGVEGESAQRRKARLERHRRTAERAAKALAEKNTCDLLAQREQAERNRLAEALDAEVKRWSSGKEANLRALLSTLQYILGPDSGWQPIPLTEVITSAAVKKAYRKATLCVHPDKLQQRGASIQQKYICEKVFDLLKEAWNRFNSEER